MAAVVGSLLVKLAADSGPLGNALRASGVDVTRFEGKTVKSLDRVDRASMGTFGRLGGLAKSGFGALALGATAALAPILSIGAALSVARTALDKFSAIADNAKFSGLDAETFQELAYQAEQSGVEFETFSKGLETFAKNSGLAVVGKGRMLTALKALNPELLANIQAATTQEQRVRLAADAIAAQGDAAKRAALSTALFGDAGAKLSDAFAGGAAQIDATAVAARKLGLVVDRDLIAKSEELGDELSTATQVMNLQFQQALVDIAPILVATARLAGGLATAIGYITDSMQELTSRGTARLEQDLAGIDSQLAAANAVYAPGVVGTMGVEIAPEGQAKLQAERDAIFAELKRRAMDQLRIGLLAPKGGSADDADHSGGANAAADAAIKQAEAVQKLVADLQHEQAQLGRSSQEQEYYNLLKRVGVEAESDYGRAIAASLNPLQAQRAELERNTEAAKTFETAANNALETLVDGILEGKDAGEILGDVFRDLTKQMLTMGIQTFTKTLTGAIFPGFDDGGYTGPGHRLKPAGIVHAGEVVWSQRDIRRAGGVGSVEAMRRGYANGGVVGTPSLPSVGYRRTDDDGGRGSLEVRIRNEGGQAIEAKSASMSRSGGLDIVDIVVGAFATGAAQGKTDGVMSNIYGVKRRGA